MMMVYFLSQLQRRMVMIRSARECLGDLFVTSTVYKDLSVINRNTKQHQLSLGLTFIPTNSGMTYKSCSHEIQDNFTDKELE